MRLAEQNKKKINPRYFLNEEVMERSTARQEILDYMASKNIMPSADPNEELVITKAAERIMQGENPVKVKEAIINQISAMRDIEFRKLSGTATQQPDALRAGLEAVETQSKEGIRCRAVALPIQQALFAAISKYNPALSNNAALKKRLSDGVVGHTTIQAINLISTASKEAGIPSFSDDRKGFAEVCRLDRKTSKAIVDAISSLDMRVISALSNLVLRDEDKRTEITTGISGTSKVPKDLNIRYGPQNWQVPESGLLQPRPEEAGRSLEESKARDASYNALKDQKSKKLFEALMGKKILKEQDDAVGLPGDIEAKKTTTDSEKKTDENYQKIKSIVEKYSKIYKPEEDPQLISKIQPIVERNLAWLGIDYGTSEGKKISSLATKITLKHFMDIGVQSINQTTPEMIGDFVQLIKLIFQNAGSQFIFLINQLLSSTGRGEALKAYKEHAKMLPEESKWLAKEIYLQIQRGLSSLNEAKKGAAGAGASAAVVAVSQQVGSGLAGAAASNAVKQSVIERFLAFIARNEGGISALLRLAPKTLWVGFTLVGAIALYALAQLIMTASNVVDIINMSSQRAKEKVERWLGPSTAPTAPATVTPATQCPAGQVKNAQGFCVATVDD